MSSDLSLPALPPAVFPGTEDADMELVGEVRRQAPPLMELGNTGLRRAAGYVDEEFLPQLRGRKSISVFREMSENDAIVGAMLFAITMLVRQVEWQVIPAGKSANDAAAARLVETCMDDMSHSWADFITECLSALVFGWSWHEIVYKRRQGPWQRDGRLRSKYSDDLFGWRKIPIRSQDTWQRWVFDEGGDVRGMVQLPPPDYRQRLIPIERSLLFRWGSHKNNPEGQSILRRAYRSWYYKKRFEEHEAIGVERDLAGLPMVRVPAAWLTPNASDKQKAQVQQFARMVKSVRRNEQEGLVFPKSVNVETKQDEYDFELLGSGGSRQFSTDTIIQRLEQRILMTVLADWIMVGHQNTGTYNMHVDKTGIFKVTLDTICQAMIADTFNRHAIPRLFAMNGWKPAMLPRIVPDSVEPPDLTQLSQFLGATAGLGFAWGPDGDMERFLRRAAKLPQLGEDDYRKRTKEARNEEMVRFAESQTRAIAARSQLAQAMAQARMQADGQDPAVAQQAQDQQMAGQQAQQAQEQHDSAMSGAKIDQMSQLQQLYSSNGNGRPQGGRPSGSGGSGGSFSGTQGRSQGARKGAKQK